MSGVILRFSLAQLISITAGHCRKDDETGLHAARVTCRVRGGWLVSIK